MEKSFERTIKITIVTALVTLGSGIVLNQIQHLDQLKQDKMKFDFEMKQDRLKFEYDIVSNIIKNGIDQNDIWKKIRFYSNLGLITTISTDSLELIANQVPVNNSIVLNESQIKSIKCQEILPQNKYRLAKEYEEKGYSYLLKGDISKSAESFKKSDSVYPGYHNSYDIYNLLRKKKYTLNSYYYLILKKYSWGISKEVTDSFKLKLNHKSK